MLKACKYCWGALCASLFAVVLLQISAGGFTVDRWYQSDAPAFEFDSLAVDSSGQFVISTMGSPFNNIYRSENYGLNWTVLTAAPHEDWRDVTSDSTGTHLTGLVYQGIIYYSNDSGASWNASLVSPQPWIAACASASGQNLVAVNSDGDDGTIYMSSDFGKNWTLANTPPFQNWRAVDSDSSGQIVFAVSTENLGLVFRSQNAGLDWTQTNAPPLSYKGVAVDSTGQYVAVCANEQGIYVSNDTGLTWRPTSAPPLDWYGIDSDSTGRYLVAVSSNPTGSIYNSADYGHSWYPSNTNNFYWTVVASDASGQYLTAATEVFQGLYTTASAGSTFLPTAAPSAAPTAGPTSQPSRQPSSQPSAFPSHLPGTFETTVTVLSQAPAARATVSQLGHGAAVYVTANLLLSYLSEESGGYVTITAGSGDSMMYISTECAPAVACPSSHSLPSTYCAVNVDVTSAITSNSGGTLLLNAITNTLDVSGTSPQLCSRAGVQGIYFELNYTVSAFRQPTFRPTPAPSTQPSASSGTVIVNKQSSLVTSDGAPFYVIGVAMAAFAALGVLVVRLHDGSKGLTPLRLLAVCSDMALQGNLIVSEIFYITVLLQSSSKLFGALAIVLIFARLQNAICAAFLLYKLYTPSTQLYEKLNKEVLLLHTKVHAAVQILMTLDCAMFRYLPWMASDLTFQSMHFPDSLSFKLCMTTRVLQSGIALVVQGIVLDRLNESDLDDSYTLGLLTLIMAMTALVFISIILTVSMHLRELKSPPGQSVDGTSGTRANPLHSVELGTMGMGMGAIGMGAVWEEKVSLLEREVAALKDAQAEQKAEQAALRRELDSNTAEMVREIKALKAATKAAVGAGAGAGAVK